MKSKHDVEAKGKASEGIRQWHYGRTRRQEQVRSSGSRSAEFNGNGKG